MRMSYAALLLAGLALPAAASATAPASRFDTPGQRHADVCGRLASASAPLRFADGTPTGYSVSDDLPGRKRRCPAGSLRVDLHEILPSPEGPLVFHNGGRFYRDADSAKYGFVLASDLAGPLGTVVQPTGGRGAPCALANEPPYTVSVQPIPRAMHYKRPQDVERGTNSGASFGHYGDPGGASGHYTYLLWSFVDVHGGGMVRTLLAPGQIVQACDVQPLTVPSWDANGELNGSVTARYVQVPSGGFSLYGWMIWSHTYGHGPPVAHASPLQLE